MNSFSQPKFVVNIMQINAVLLLRYKKGKHKRYVNYYSSRTLKDAEGTALGDDGHDVAGEMNKRRSPFPPSQFLLSFSLFHLCRFAIASLGNESVKCPHSV